MPEAPIPRWRDHVDNAYRQIGALETLAVILRMAGERGLPGLAWRITSNGSALWGQVDLVVHGKRRQQERDEWRLLFNHYVPILEELRDRSIERYGAVQPSRMPTRLHVTEQTDADGMVRLQACLRSVTIDLPDGQHYWLAEVGVWARLIPDLPIDEDPP